MTDLEQQIIAPPPRGIGQWIPRLLRRRWLPLAILIGAAALLMWRSLAGGIFLPLDIIPHLHPWRFSYERVPVNNATISDVVQQVYPRREVANAMAWQGAWPLWNPTILTGTPFLADGQLAFFYPPSLLLLLLPPELAYGYYALLQLILAGIGTYLFLRHIGVGRGAATLSGICYMFSGYVLTWLEFPHHSGASALLPWAFWAVARAIDRRSIGAWLIAGTILTFPLLTQIQLAFYIYSGVGCYVLVRLIMKQSWRSRAYLAGGFAVALIVALALSAVQLLPQVALSADGQRADQSTAQASPEAQYVLFMRLFLPALGGEPRVPPPVWGTASLQAPQPYTGLIPLALAGLALLLSRRRETAIFCMLALIAFALAVRSPLLSLLVTLVPPYRQFADHERWLVLWGFAIAVLAGLGAQALRERTLGIKMQDARRMLLLNRSLLGAIILFIAGWSWLHLALFTANSHYGMYLSLIYRQSLRPPLVIGAISLVALGLFAFRRVPQTVRWGMLLLVVTGDLLWYGGSYETSTTTSIFQPTNDLLAALPQHSIARKAGEPLYPPTRQIEFLSQQPRPFRFLGGDYPTLLPNLASAFGLEDVRGYQSLYLARYNRLARLIDGKDYTRLASEGGTSFRPYLTSAYTHRRLLDMLNVAYIVFPPGSKNPPLYGALELVQQDDEGTIYRNPSVLPRAWLVHHVEVVPDDDAQLARLAQPDFDPATVALLASAPPQVEAPVAGDRITAIEYGPNRLHITATAASAALLVVSDAYTSDWHVTVDGVPATLYRANYMLRGVWLSSGTHELVFTYRPRAFLIGGAISGATLATLGVYAATIYLRPQRLRRRRRGHPIES